MRLHSSEMAAQARLVSISKNILLLISTTEIYIFGVDFGEGIGRFPRRTKFRGGDGSSGCFYLSEQRLGYQHSYLRTIQKYEN